MSDKKWWSTKVDEKLLSDLVIFSIFFENSISFPRISPSSATKPFNVFFNWYKYWIILKYF